MPRTLKIIRGHKGQNSTGTRCRGFLVLESRCRGFLVLESRCRSFLSSEKMSQNHDVVAYLSHFSMSWCFGLGISMSRFFGLRISMSWFFGLGISMSWCMCLHGLVFIVKIEKIMHNYVN